MQVGALGLVLGVGTAAVAGASGVLYYQRAGSGPAADSAAPPTAPLKLPESCVAFAKWCDANTATLGKDRGAFCAMIKTQPLPAETIIKNLGRGCEIMLEEATTGTARITDADLQMLPGLSLEKCEPVLKWCASDDPVMKQAIAVEACAKIRANIFGNAGAVDENTQAGCDRLLPFANKHATSAPAATKDDSWASAVPSWVPWAGKSWVPWAGKTEAKHDCAWLYKRCAEIDPNRSPMVAHLGGAQVCGMLQLSYLLNKGFNAETEAVCAKSAHLFEPGGLPEIPAGMPATGGLFGQGYQPPVEGEEEETVYYEQTVVERPVYVEQPVYYERQVYVEQPVYVPEPIYIPEPVYDPPPVYNYDDGY